MAKACTSAELAQLKAKRAKRAKPASSGRPIIDGKPWGHKTAPKKYREMGATRAADYAFPNSFMYPLIFRRGGKLRQEVSRRHVSNAEARFTQDRRRYPASVQATILANIAKAKKRLGM